MHCALCLAFAATAAKAAEWFVSPDGTDATGRGTSEAAPFRTIQFAVDTASADDTITLLPGDYEEGSATVNSLVSRVNVTKKLTIRSKNGRASRDTTRIIGAYDPGAASTAGLGPNAIRCVRIGSSGAGSRLEGVTFYGGATDYNGNAGAEKSEGGGVYVANNIAATIVDCAFVDCRSTRGGGLYSDYTGGTLIQVHRCLFKRCLDTKFGAGMRGGGAYNCVFDDCGNARNASGNTFGEAGNAKNAMSYCYTAVSCTFVNNEGYGVSMASAMAGGVYNCLFQNNGDGAIGSEKSNLAGGNTANISLPTRLEVFSPYDNDYRLTAIASAKTAGNATYLSKIPEGFRDTDYCGNPRATDGIVYAGAVQDALTGTASGVGFSRTTNGYYTLDGEPMVACAYRTWRGTLGWPVPQKVGFIPLSGYALVRFTIGESNIWPLPDDTAWIHPYRADIAQTVGTVVATGIFYTAPDGSDETGDGTEANPFATITKAIQFSNASHVVRVKAGDYNTGSQTAGGMPSRVVVPESLAGSVRVVAVDGPDVTFITGEDGTDDAECKVGAGAVRCIAVLSTNKFLAAFQGFTLRNGHSQGADTSVSGPHTCGGGLINVNSQGVGTATGFLLDCRVEDCSARRGGAMFGGTALRCVFSGCASANGGGGGVFRSCAVISSFVTGCFGRSEIFSAGATGCNVTTYGNSFGAIFKGGIGKGIIHNSILTARTANGNDIWLESALDADQVKNTLCSRANSTAISQLDETLVLENPVRFQDAVSGNYRLRGDSAGCTLATTGYLNSCMDIEGNPFHFASGSYEVGCYALHDAATIYVDAANGSDVTADGSEAAPFATLAAAMSAADYGDTVIALPGTYDSGMMLQTLAQSGGSVEPALPARVVVKPGVTLASRGGAAATIIQGATSTDSAAVSGCGAGAVRGVFLCKNATLRGFTVTDGHTHFGDSSSMTVNDYGGGVGGYYGTTATAEEFSALVEDCILTGNVACRGGGAMFGTYRNCFFTANTLAMDKPGWAVARARLEGCLFSGNGPSGSHSTIYGCDVVNCTVLEGQAGNTGVICNENSYQNTRSVLNTIVIAGRIKVNVCANCLFGSGVSNIYDTPRMSGIVIGDARLDANGVPLAGSPAIDAGDNALASAALLSSFDPAGTRRVLNSTIDIGAFEYDWGVPWGKAIGGRHLVIDDMPSDAALSGGNTLVFGGAEVPVSMIWDKGGNQASYTFSAEVTGSGTLTITANGAEVATLTAADGVQRLSFHSSFDSNALLFAYDGEESDVVALSSFSHQAPFVLIVR